jgi:hypothetical protein
MRRRAGVIDESSELRLGKPARLGGPKKLKVNEL